MRSAPVGSDREDAGALGRARPAARRRSSMPSPLIGAVGPGAGEHGRPVSTTSALGPNGSASQRRASRASATGAARDRTRRAVRRARRRGRRSAGRCARRRSSSGNAACCRRARARSACPTRRRRAGSRLATPSACNAPSPASAGCSASQSTTAASLAPAGARTDLVAGRRRDVERVGGERQRRRARSRRRARRAGRPAARRRSARATSPRPGCRRVAAVDLAEGGGERARVGHEQQVERRAGRDPGRWRDRRRRARRRSRGAPRARRSPAGASSRTCSVARGADGEDAARPGHAADARLEHDLAGGPGVVADVDRRGRVASAPWKGGVVTVTPAIATLSSVRPICT